MVIRIRRITDEHKTVIEHQHQHLRDGDPTKLWGALSQTAEKCLTSIVQDDRKDKCRHRQRTTQNEILQSLTNDGKGIRVDTALCQFMSLHQQAGSTPSPKPADDFNTSRQASRPVAFWRRVGRNPQGHEIEEHPIDKWTSDPPIIRKAIFHIEAAKKTEKPNGNRRRTSNHHCQNEQKHCQD